jgi:hypothetical protein
MPSPPFITLASSQQHSLYCTYTEWVSVGIRFSAPFSSLPLTHCPVNFCV